MDLDKTWAWKTKRLACRIRPETIRGNPAGDELRERFAELAGADLREILSEMKTTKKKKEQNNKLMIDHESDKIFNNVLTRSHVLNASEQTIEKLKAYDDAHEATLTQKNLKKVFTLLPKSPPKRVLLELQRERAKPLRLPNPDEQLIAQMKLEKRLAKQRAERKAAIDQQAPEMDPEAAREYEEKKSNFVGTIKNIFKDYQGDKFGSGGPYLESMLYLSRMPNAVEKSDRGHKSKLAPTNTTSSFSSDALSTTLKKADEDSSRVDSMDLNGMSEATSTSDLNSKLFCAISLCNWSRNPANAHRLAAEGAIRAISQLFMENNPRISMYCASAFRFMSEHSPLANAMIEEGAISTISDIISSTTEEFEITNLSIALVNLTRVNGRESQVVEAGIVVALMNVILMRQELAGMCIRGMYNLTCVDAPYPFIERLVRALVSMSSSGTYNVKHICAAAICNLSDLKTVVRSKLVEEGAINILGPLSRGAETRTRRVCAVILQNLSASKACRIEMTSRSGVTVAYGLSSDQDPVILRAICLTISRLALEPSNNSRIIYESGITALCNIGVKYPTVPGISQPIAMAFQLLSSTASARPSIVQEGSITPIASLLRLSSDVLTLQHGLLALCNLLIESDSHQSIVQQGVINTLINLSNNDNGYIKDFCALAFLNLSMVEESQKHLVRGGAVRAITNLAAKDSVVTRRRCAAAFSNVSNFPEGMSIMVEDGIIPILVSLISSADVETIHFSCVALCRLSMTEENGEVILSCGAIPQLVQCAMAGSTETMKFCGSILSSLSFYQSCRIPLCECGIISVLQSLSNLNDEVTKQRCLVAYANLSCEVGVQNQLVEEGVVQIIAALAESYQEVNYICCAKAMCNLACNEELRLRVAKDGGYSALLMISMVHSVDEHTKLLCILGLLNFVGDNTVEYLLDKDQAIVSVVSNLSKLTDPSIKHLCAKIFNRLSSYKDGREKMCEKRSFLAALFDLIEGEGNTEIKTIVCLTACNLIFNDDVRSRAIEAGAFRVIEAGIQLEDEDASLNCVKALFIASKTPEFLPLLAVGSPVVTILRVALQCYGDKYSYCLKVLSLVGWHPQSRPRLHQTDFIALLLALIHNNLQDETVSSVLTVMKYIVMGHNNVTELVALGFPSALWTVHEAIDIGDASEAQHISWMYLVEIIRTLCEKSANIDIMATPKTISMLKTASAFVAEEGQSIYDLSASLYFCAGSSLQSRISIANKDMIEIYAVVCSSKSIELSSAVLVASLCMYLLEHKTREPFLSDTIATMLHKILKLKSSDATINGAVSAVYAMSKMKKSREVLCESSRSLETEIQQLSYTNVSAAIKANCVRALKNMSSDTSDAIEEGAVAALIAISLEGKLSKSKEIDEFQVPVIVPVNTSKLSPPSCCTEKVTDGEWFYEHSATMGGAAGKGPESPFPPLIELVGSDCYPEMADDVETVEANEGKTKMAFAKMQVPQEMRTSFLLTDKDFLVKQDDDTSIENFDSKDEITIENTDYSINDGKPPPKGRSANSSPVLRERKSLYTGSPTASQQKSLAGGSQQKGPGGKRLSPLSADDNNNNTAGATSRPGSHQRNRSSSSANESSVSEQAAQLGLYA